MKLEVPSVGEISTCVDDSCDLSHCRICGGHFIDPYTTCHICTRCDMLEPFDFNLVCLAVQANWEKLYGIDLTEGE